MAPAVASVFISHSSQDKAFVNRLASRLKAAGVEKIWYDTLELGPVVDDLPARIKEGIAAADCFLIVLSPGSQRSQWVSYEIQAAIEGSKIVIPLVLSSKGGVDLRDNPHVNELLRGGRHKVIEVTDDFEHAVSQVLLVLAPDRGRRRVIEQTLTTMLNDEDPDVAELAMTQAALTPDEYLPSLLELVATGRDDVKPRYRLERSLTHFGEQALGPLFAFLLRREEVPSTAIPSEIPHDVDPQTGEVLYTGESFSDVLRHIILSGGNRAWKAQHVAKRCIVALAESSPHLRSLAQRTLETELSVALQQIAVNKRTAVVSDAGYDALRLAIETAGLLVKDPQSLDPWMIHEFANTPLWGPDESPNAKDKLGSYIVDCLSRIGTRQALDYLLAMADEAEIRKLFFTPGRSTNPWNTCFIRFGNAAVDVLLERLQRDDSAFRPFALRNLSGIPNPRGLRVVLEAIGSADSGTATALLTRTAGQAVPEISDDIVRRFAEERFIRDGLYPGHRDDIEAAVAHACASATDKPLVTKVCTALQRSGDAQTLWHLVEAIRVHRIHSLYEFLTTAFAAHAWAAVRGGAGIALARLGEITADGIMRQLKTAEEQTERPYLSIALAHLGDSRAIPGLVDGLKNSFLSGNRAEHDQYAAALSMLSDPNASEMRAKWYHRI